MVESFDTVIGLEVHVQLNTKTKQFCNDANQFGDEANVHTSSISLAHPGTLPSINTNTVEKAIKLALALGSKLNFENRFDRKHYFYPDLPKGYQITQDNTPICVGGHLALDSGKIIRFHHIHMEEDAGKSIHHLEETVSCIDLNRAGVPLLEIVTEPDLSTGKEVHEFIAKLQQIVRYIDISDGNMEQGSLRCDCNVSVKPAGSEVLGERCEIKNLNSKKFASIAVDYEAKRQIAEIKAGNKITMQTLHFDPVQGSTSPTRDKESAHDYRYFPDPDLPPIIIEEALLEKVKAQMPLLPEALKEKLLTEFNLSKEQAHILTSELDISSYFIEHSKIIKNSKSLANFFVNILLPFIKNQDIEINTLQVSSAHWQEFLTLIAEEKINKTDAVGKLLPTIIGEQKTSPLKHAEALDILISKGDSEASTSLIQEIIQAFPEEVNKYKSGKKALIGFFVGEAMKRSKGKVNPKTIKIELEQALLATFT